MTNRELEPLILKLPSVGEAMPRKRRRVLLLLVLGLVVCFCWFAYREHQGSLIRQQAHTVVSELDGRMGSLPFWPFGSEYFISFENRSFTEAELTKLECLDSLSRWGTNYVIVHFRDTNLTKADIEDLRKSCPRCKVHRVINNELLIYE